MNKKKLLIAAVIIGAIAAYFIWANFLKTAPSMRKLDTAFQVEAVALYKEFDSNEATANAKYLNKIIEVTGVVANIEVSEDSKPTLALKQKDLALLNALWSLI